MNHQRIPTDVRSVARPYAPLLWYAVIEVGLMVGALVIPFPVGGLLNQLAMLVGLVVLTARVARARPEPRTAWWLVAATGWTLVAGGVVASVLYGLKGGVDVSDPSSLVLAAAPFFILGAALGLFSRVAPRRGPADSLDALVVALAAFLVLWELRLAAAFAVDLVPAIIATILPLGVLVVLTMGIKLVLGGGAKDPSIALVIVGAAALTATTTLLLVPGIGRATLPVSPAVNLFWASFGAANGAAALHPALTRPRAWRERRVDDTSMARTLLFALVALVPLVVWAIESGHQSAPVGQAVPIAVSAMLLVLLVARMGLVSRIAHQRATQLHRRSRALATAMSREQDLQRQLAYRATHDPLTTLSNRTVLQERMEEAMAIPRRHALLLFDLDRFKDVNDTYGHPVGDRLLVAVAERLRQAVPDGTVLARLGGDEFAAFLEDADEKRAVGVASRLLGRLRPPYIVDGHEFLMTASVGVLTTDPDGPPLSPTAALSDADLALYRAKELGKDRIERFRPELRRDRVDHARVTSGLRKALDEEAFALRYQPVVSLESGSIVAVEALLRWHHPDGMLMSPEDFLPVAEDAGLMGRIGDWVLRQACRDARRWHADRGVSVFVNVSGRQLDQPGFATTVVKAIADAGLPPEAVVLEITEGSLLTASPVDVRFRQLQALREHHVRLAIDDFGTGYSSLSYVAQLPIDFVKIDRSLTQIVDGDPTSQRGWAFTRAVVELVNSLELTAVAEGVETAEQARALRATRCPLAQGYHLSRPVEAHGIDALLGLQPATAGSPAAGRTPRRTPGPGR